MKELNPYTKRLYNIAQKRSKKNIEYKKYDDKYINFSIRISNFNSEEN